MARPLMLIPAVFSLVFTLIPAFAEVETLQTDRQLYSVDMYIKFSGTVDSTDAGKLVNLMVFNPDGKLVLVTGDLSAANGTFQIVANTNDPTQFGNKGAYGATAFVNTQATGKTIYFDFSPDGSPVTHVTQSNQTAQEGSAPIASQSPGARHFESVIGENLSAQDLTNMSMGQGSPTAAETPHGVGISDVIYPAMAACGAAIVGVITYRKVRSRKVAPTQPPAKQEEGEGMHDPAMVILKNRLAKGEITLDEFKATRDALAEP